MKKHKLNLALVLPGDAHACEVCVKRLVESLQGRPGIVEAHVDRTDATNPVLCLHYDSTAIRVKDIEARVAATGASLESRYEHLSIEVKGVGHERQARLVEEALAATPGVLHSAVAVGSGRAYLEFDPSLTNREMLVATLERVGVSPVREKAAPKGDEHGDDDGHDHGHGGPFGERSELIFSIGCGVLTLTGWILEKVSVPAAIPVALFVIAYVLGGWFTVKEVVAALRAKKFEIDFLMLLAAIGAALLGEWFEGALLLFLFTIGHALEGYAMRRARNAIAALAKLVPETAVRVAPDGVETEVPVGDLVVGDRLLVRPNTRVPADGFVVDGTSSVNQAPITGESVPVDKRPVPDDKAALNAPDSVDAAHRVFAGSINGASALVTVVTKAAADSTLARVVKLVEEAETQKSPTQQFTDRFERIFVPAIIVAVVILLFAWVVIDEPVSKSFYRAMAVLVAASPCALAIATPSAVLSGVARAARSGVLVKGGAHLESLGLVRAIAFDKTGTLTEGKPKLTDVSVMLGVDELDLLRVSVAVEKRSDHPLASAIVDGGVPRLQGVTVPDAKNVEAVIGYGVRGEVGGQPVSIGKPGLFTREGALPPDVAAAVEKLQVEGRTVMVVRRGTTFLGVLGVMDTPRESAREVIARLHELGIEQTIMLTGDNQRVADAVAKQVGIRVARGDLLPEQKVEAISELARSKSRVAMVGDGVNDAPAMANATVGIAMGAGGSDVALETADVALMADDLRALPFAVGLSRAARRIIQQNLWASLGMVAFLVPATIVGFAGIGAAVALHEGSTLLVVANALRLLAYSKNK